MNTNAITITGASDDLIEVEGAIREEFYAKDDENNYLAFNEGTILRVRYDDAGIWRVSVVREGRATVAVKTCPDGPEEEVGYTDIASLTGDLPTTARYSASEGEAVGMIPVVTHPPLSQEGIPE